MTEHSQEEAQAEVKVAKWSPWVWVVPAVAIFFVGYLIVRYGFFGGGDITVRFVEARGLDRYSPVRFRGAKVGTVQKISIDENMREVVVRISMDASMNHALRRTLASGSWSRGSKEEGSAVCFLEPMSVSRRAKGKIRASS